LKTKITKRAMELKSNESKLTRILWEDYFKKLDEKKMRVEMEGPLITIINTGEKVARRRSIL
jgi:hypothetical protein